MYRSYTNIGFLTFFGPHNFIFQFDKKFDYTYENICIDNVYGHILDVVTMNLVIYIGYSDILDIGYIGFSDNLAKNAYGLRISEGPAQIF